MTADTLSEPVMLCEVEIEAGERANDSELLFKLRRIRREHPNTKLTVKVLAHIATPTEDIVEIP